MIRNFAYPSTLAAALLWSLGCTTDPGSHGDGAGGAGAAAGAAAFGGNPGGVDVSCTQGAAPGVSPLMKLSTKQYRNTVRDLLRAVSADPVVERVESLLASIPDDSTSDGFTGRDNRTALEHVQGYFNVGRSVGDALAADSVLLASVAGECAREAALSPACVNGFLDRFVQLAYRRPLLESERAEYAALNDGSRSPAAAIRAMVIVALSSPRFVHHVEVDGAAIDGTTDLMRISPYETASRLSYLFWQTMPDEQLFAAAADGSLETDAGFAQQLERVFADDRTRETIWSFWNEWLRLEKFTGFEIGRPALQALAAGESLGAPGHDHYGDMVQEVRDLTELFTFQRVGTLSQLLTTDLSVTPSPDLAKLYGVAPWEGRGDYPQLPAGTRAGLLQRAALLVSNLEQTNPFHRGAFMRRYLLCDPLPQPDPNSLPPGALDPPPVSSAQTTRQRFQAKVEGNPLCQACHAGFSDLGYVLESFDALGRYRTSEKVYDEKNGQYLAELPIDTNATLRITGEAVPVTSAAELNQRVVASQKVEACMARLYFEFANRRPVADDSSDHCAVQDMKSGLNEPAVGISGTFKRIARYPGFFQRKVGPQ